MKRILNILIVTIIMVNLFPITASASSIFQQFSLVGDAFYSNNEIVLTTENRNRKGAAWANEKLNLAKPFEIEAKVLMANQINGIADGMTFTMHNDARRVSSIGTDGAGLSAYGSNYIKNALSIEYDVYYNGDSYHASTDPARSYGKTAHMAVTIPNSRVTANGHNNTYWFNPVNNYVNVRYSWTPYNTANNSLGGILNYSFGSVTYSYFINDVYNTFGSNNVYWGFTASTGNCVGSFKVQITKLPYEDNSIQLDGQVLWSDLNDFFSTRPKDTVVSLYRNGSFQTSITVLSNSDGKFSFKNLDPYGVDGIPYKYTVQQDYTPTGYNKINSTNNNTIINDLKVQKVTIEFRNSSNNYKIKEDMVCPIYYGASLNIPSPKISGYKTSVPEYYNFNRITSDNRIVFNYTPN